MKQSEHDDHISQANSVRVTYQPPSRWNELKNTQCEVRRKAWYLFQVESTEDREDRLLQTVLAE
jgi:hypothetical protein